MDHAAAKTSSHALFIEVLHLITSCTELVAREIDCAQLYSEKFSRADQHKLKRTAKGLVAIGLLARIIDQSSRPEEQRPIRGGRSVNIWAGSEKDLPIAKREEHAIAPQPNGGALV
jgi:hypothetical protein